VSVRNTSGPPGAVKLIARISAGKSPAIPKSPKPALQNKDALLQADKLAGRITLSWIDSKPVPLRCCAMMEEPDLPRPRGDAASHLASEDLGPYSQAELDDRIALLQAEIIRVKSHREKAATHRAAADALFGAAKKGAGA
jgi:uncharacterized small protein (DUF1192 family)